MIKTGFIFLVICFSFFARASGEPENRLLEYCRAEIKNGIKAQAYYSFSRQFSFDYVVSYNGYWLTPNDDKIYDVMLSVTAVDLLGHTREYIFKGYELDISNRNCALKDLGYSKIDE